MRRACCRLPRMRCPRKGCCGCPNMCLEPTNSHQDPWRSGSIRLFRSHLVASLGQSLAWTVDLPHYNPQASCLSAPGKTPDGSPLPLQGKCSRIRVEIVVLSVRVDQEHWRSHSRNTRLRPIAEYCAYGRQGSRIVRVGNGDQSGEVGRNHASLECFPWLHGGLPASLVVVLTLPLPR